MAYNADDTICAISSGSGGAARGLIRLSGSDAVAIASGLFQADDRSAIQGVTTATTKAGRLRVPLGDSVSRFAPALQRQEEVNVPCELFVWPTHRSYTREPVAEVHTVGSPPILQAVLAALCRAGARLAEPGEFTLRAFLAGRLDLTQVEAVLGVIDAPDHDSLSDALSQLAGGLARPLDQARNDLTQLLAELEAGLDFVDDDIRFISESETVDRLRLLRQVLDEVDQQLESRNTERELPQVALIGPPNVGKSSLFNALAARFGQRAGSAPGQIVRALVSPRGGTTRDFLSIVISTGDISFELFDTAGLDAEIASDSEAIEKSSQVHTSDRRARANVRAYCMEAYNGSAQADVHRCGPPPDDCNVVILTKSDVWGLQGQATASVLPSCELPVVVTSSATGEGLDDLCNAFQKLLLREISSQRPSTVCSTALRCRESVRCAASALRRAKEIAENSVGDELVTAELRVALAELGKVVGAVYTDDLLDRIFKTFCIGK